MQLRVVHVNVLSKKRRRVVLFVGHDFHSKSAGLTDKQKRLEICIGMFVHRFVEEYVAGELQGMMSTPGHASRAFLANRQILCDKKVPVTRRFVSQFGFVFFDLVITPVAPFFAFGLRTIRMGDLYKLDVVFRKMLRMIVGPPNFVEWNAPWHDILHHWNGKALAFAQQHGLNTWSKQCFKQSQSQSLLARRQPL